MNAKSWFYAQSFNGGTRGGAESIKPVRSVTDELRDENAKLREENRLLRVAIDELGRQLTETESHG
jgi:hypothetical protein